MGPQYLRLFSPTHFLILAAVLAAWVGIGWFSLQLKTEKQKKRVAAGLAALLFGLEVISTVNKQIRVSFDPTMSLPFHLCDLAFLAMLGALLWRKQILYEFAYFFGFGGAVFALLTPNLHDPVWHFFSIRFFISHAGACASVIFLTFAFHLRPTWRSVWQMIVAGNLYMVFAGLLNWLAGTNFGYLCEKPPNPSLLDYLGSWPLYIIWYEAIGLIVIPLLYLPFYIYDRREAKEDDSSSRTATGSER